MSDKVQLIKEEIKRGIEQCYRLLAQDLLERERNETNCCLQQYKELLQFIESLPKELEDEHWQEVRERAAIAAMQGLAANPKLFYDNGEEKIDITARAIRYADALVEGLKKK